MGQSGPCLLLNHSYFGQGQLVFLLQCLKNICLHLPSRKESYENGMFSICSGFFGVFIVISMVLNDMNKVKEYFNLGLHFKNVKPDV